MASKPPPPATIKIADDALDKVRSRQSAHSTGVAGPSNAAGGIYNTRSVSRVSVDRRSAGRPSQDPSSAHDVEEGDDWRDDGGRRKQVFRGKTLLW